jgi:hypothetical protein
MNTLRLDGCVNMALVYPAGTWRRNILAESTYFQCGTKNSQTINVGLHDPNLSSYQSFLFGCGSHDCVAFCRKFRRGFFCTDQLCASTCLSPGELAIVVLAAVPLPSVLIHAALFFLLADAVPHLVGDSQIRGAGPIVPNRINSPRRTAIRKLAFTVVTSLVPPNLVF